MSMRIVASVQLKRTLFNIPVPQNWEKTAGLTTWQDTTFKNIQDKHTCNAQRLLRLRDVAQQPR